MDRKLSNVESLLNVQPRKHRVAWKFLIGEVLCIFPFIRLMLNQPALIRSQEVLGVKRAPNTGQKINHHFRLKIGT